MAVAALVAASAVALVAALVTALVATLVAALIAALIAAVLIRDAVLIAAVLISDAVLIAAVLSAVVLIIAAVVRFKNILTDKNRSAACVDINICFEISVGIVNRKDVVGSLRNVGGTGLNSRITVCRGNSVRVQRDSLKVALTVRRGFLSGWLGRLFV